MPKEFTSEQNTIIESPFLFFVYLSRRNVGEDVDKKALGYNGLPCVIIKKDSIDAPLSSLMELIVSPKVKTTEGEGVGARSLACNTSGIEGRVRASR